MMPPDKIEIKNNGKIFTIRRASLRDSIRRSDLALKMSEESEESEDDQVNVIEAFYKKIVYPSLIACTEMENDITFDEFLELDDAFIELWYESAQKINSHWFDNLNPEEQQKKT